MVIVKGVSQRRKKWDVGEVANASVDVAAMRLLATAKHQLSTSAEYSPSSV
jgi:hypothetical protein